ncbi:MAG TPA: aldo/keto reductase [Candidatus Saccharimonadales bacterium]|nr:aldo/keto reductase [Candidatus Saccharimonadales bacterium]
MEDSFTLGNGVRMPAIGFGTWEISPDDTAETAVRTALEMGYRHIDTAKIYGNEQGIGRAVRASGVPREEIFITTKLWNSDHAYDDAMQSIDGSLERLGLEYVDLYLIHWPQSDARDEAWKALTEIYESGKAKSIGVSNYTVRHLEELLGQSDVVPMVNQVEFHPFIYEQQKDLVDYCKDKNILIEAYSPLSRHSKTSHPEIEQIAEQAGKTPSQVILRWCLQHGTVPLPRSQNPDHIKENLEIFDFELDDQAMETLNSLSDGDRVTSDPEDIP